MGIGDGDHNRLVQAASFFYDEINNLPGFGILDDGDIPHGSDESSQRRRKHGMERIAAS
jgi:hypothetical protein